MRSPSHTRFGTKPLYLVRSAGAAQNSSQSNALANPQTPSPQSLGRAMTFLDHIDWGQVAFWAAVGGIGYFAYHNLSEKKQRRAA